MTKYFSFIIISLAIIGCSFDNSNQEKSNSNRKQNNKLLDTVYVKKWLTNVITDYVNSEDSKEDNKNLQEVLTADYYEYKIDAITLEYSDMTLEDFHNKWKSKFDTKLVGGGGFFTSVMDHGKVKVTMCKLLKKSGDKKSTFQTIVHDLRWNTDYKFDIKIISKDNKLLIEDVQEYNQVQ